MSVIGIDFGNRNAVISCAKRGAIETLLNEGSKRATDCRVSFQGKQRFMGDAAVPLITSNFRNTVSDLKRFIGRSWSDEGTQADIAFLPYNSYFKELPDDRIGIEVNYQGEHKVFTPEDLCGMLLGSLKRTAEFASERAVSDIVFSVPVFWNDRQRRTFLDAAKIANLNVLGLINDGTAAALSYGIWKSAKNQFDSENKEYIMFVDMGQSSFQVTIAAYVQGKLSIVASAYDANLGGRNFDRALAEKFAADFETKYKCGNPLNNPKSAIKLMTACEKLKQTFSPEGVTEAPIKVEYLMNEIDFFSKLTLEEFNEIITPSVERLRAPLVQALKASGLRIDQISAIEILGGSTRVRAVKRCISETLGLDSSSSLYGLSATQNADECISRGCALRCAMLSPAFRVKEFHVKDNVVFPIELSWEQTDALAAGKVDLEEDGKGMSVGENHVTLFECGKESPLSRRILFRRSKPFEVQVSYADVSNTGQQLIGSFRISGMSSKDLQEPPQIRVDFKQDEFGLVSVIGAEQVVEVQVEKPETAPETAQQNESSEKDECEPSENNDAKKSDEKAKKNMIKKVKLIKLKVESSFWKAMGQSDLSNARSREQEFEDHDAALKATMNAKNSLEEFVYTTRDKLGDQLREFVTEEERAELLQKLAAMEDWLYDEGDDETKSVYQKKLADLKTISNVYVDRWKENTERPQAAAALRKQISLYCEIVNSPDEKYAHLTKEDRESVLVACAAAEKWLTEQMNAQAERELFENPIILSADIESKSNDLRKTCKPIVNKQKPVPKKKEKANDEGKESNGDSKESNEEDQPMEKDESAAEEGGQPEDKQSAQENEMDVD